jgi:hypothetical protein
MGSKNAVAISTTEVRTVVANDVTRIKERVESEGGSKDYFSRTTTFSTRVWTDQFERTVKLEDKKFLRTLLRNYFIYGVTNPSDLFRETARESWASMLNVIPNDVILAPLMIKGYEIGRLTGYTLSTKNKRFELALLGIHKSPVISRTSKVLFNPQTLYFDKIDQALLEHTNKPLLVVDDVCEFFGFANQIAERFGSSREMFFLFGMRMPQALTSIGAKNFVEVAYDEDSGRILYKFESKTKPKISKKVEKGITDPTTMLRSNARLKLKSGNWNQFEVLDMFRGHIASGKDMQESIADTGPAGHVGFRVNEFIVAEAVDKPFGTKVKFGGLMFDVPQSEIGKVNTALVLNSNTIEIEPLSGNVTGRVIRSVQWPLETGWYKTDNGVPYNEKSLWTDRNAVYLRRVKSKPFIGSLVHSRGGIGVLGNRRRGIDANYDANVEFGVATLL